MCWYGCVPDTRRLHWGADDWVYRGLDTADNHQGNGEEKGVAQVLDGLEDGDVLHKGSVPNETENKGADEKGEHEDEKLGECIRLIFGFDNFLEHLLFTDIFF
jgi:hypothetical protein